MDKVDFDKYQLVQIEKGIDTKIDISKYKNPNIPHTTMYEIRKGLEYGVDITPYIQGLSYLQIREIRFSMENGISTDVLISEKYSSFQMKEIRLGIQARIEYQQYCDPKLDYKEMCAIRHKLTSQKLSTREMYYAIYVDTDKSFKIHTIGENNHPVLFTKRRFSHLNDAKTHIENAMKVDNFYKTKSTIVGGLPALREICKRHENLRAMENGEYIRKVQSYYIICENDNYAFGYSPTEQSPFAVWQVTGKESYFFGQYYSGFDSRLTECLDKAGFSCEKIIESLNESGIDVEFEIDNKAEEEMEI